MKQPMQMTNPRPLHHRGSAYIAVLGASTIVMMIGLSAMMAIRIEQSVGEDMGDTVAARIGARSAIEYAMWVLANDRAWRDKFTHAKWHQVSFGSGTLSWKLVDVADGDLADDPTQPVRLYGRAISGDASRTQSVRLEPTPASLNILQTCVHCARDLEIRSGDTLTLTGAPASTNKSFKNLGTLYGDVDASSMTGSGSVIGSTNIPALPKAMPASTVIDDYIVKATVLAYNGHLDKVVLAPDRNEYGGGLNANGVYFIDTEGNDIEIKKSRIHGTLIVDAGSMKVTVKDQVFLENYRSNFPVLIVRGKLRLQHTSSGTYSEAYLRESDWSHNFNPPGAPHQSVSDGDQLDQYPSEVRGLIHATKDVLMKNSARVVGTIICEGKVEIEHDPEIVHNSTVLANPPHGYTTSNGPLHIVPGSWRQDVN